MRNRISQLFVRFALAIIHGAQKVLPFFIAAFMLILVEPIRLLWKLIRPLALQIYRLYVVLRQRARRFFHAQHIVLAVITHRFTLHILIFLITATVVFANVATAQQVRAEEFARGSLVSQIFNPNEETTVTADEYVRPQLSYIDTSASVRQTVGIDGSVVVEVSDSVVAGTSGSALVKANVIDDGTSAQARRTEIVQHIVQGGETISTIAEQYGITTQTVLSANNLTDSTARGVRPGDSLYILPVSGVPHTVGSGETIQGIADKYDAEVEEILEYNDFDSGADLIAGVEIIVPGGSQPAPVPEPTTRLASITSVFSGGTSSAPAASTGGGTPAPNAAVNTSTKLQWPTTTRRISQYYGYRHNGLDIDGEFGDPIYAADGGRVTTAGWGGAYGLQVVIDHGNGVVTRYAHLQTLYVSAGQSVSRAQTLGEQGSTGRSSGSHLHYEVIVGGRTVNPFSYH